ncbi:MAG: DUF3089 domain-containing protein [Alphaproteobacteria bacterium]
MGKKLLISLLVLVVLGAVALVMAPGLVTNAMLKPGHSFDDETAFRAPAPDYHDPASWIGWPGRDDIADQVPPGLAVVPEEARKADVFYVHPTVNFQKALWNADISNGEVNALTEYLPVQMQATAYNGCCRVYAPRYRQATIWTYMADHDDNRAALDLAYQDVRRAFYHFVDSIAPDTPIVLASHSQGSTHLMRLLIDELAASPLMERVVAVYAIGVFTPQAQLEQALPNLPLCQSADETGCLITWDAYRPGASFFADGREDQPGVWMGDAYRLPAERARACVNPLVWATAEGGPELHKGILESDLASFANIFLGGDVDLANTPSMLGVSPANFGAKCVEGGLLLAGDMPPIVAQSPDRDGSGSLHLLDYALFYTNIFENAQTRVDAFVANGGGE